MYAVQTLLCCLLMTFANSLDLDQEKRQDVGSKVSAPLMAFLKEFFEKVDFEKISRQQKSIQNNPVDKELNCLPFIFLFQHFSFMQASVKELLVSFCAPLLTQNFYAQVITSNKTSWQNTNNFKFELYFKHIQQIESTTTEDLN